MTRDDLRRTALARRDAIPSEEREARAIRIKDAVIALLEARAARSVHCYISFRSEVSTRSLIPELLERGLRVVVPVVERLDGREFLVHTEIQGLDNLQQGRFGLEEPRERSIASLEGLDAVIVPLATYDRRGNRLGYGKGFYDRFLAELPTTVLRIGLAFSAQETLEIPSLPHDMRLHMIVTDDEVIDLETENQAA